MMNAESIELGVLDPVGDWNPLWERIVVTRKTDCKQIYRLR